MRGIKIDAYTQSVYDVDHPDTLKDIYDQLSSPVHRVETFEAIQMGAHVMYVDEVGLLVAEKRPDDIRFFQLKGFLQLLAGNGLILGSDPWGNSKSASLALDTVRDRVSFPDVKMVGWAPGAAFANMIHGPQPIFEPRIDREPGHA